MRIVNRFFIIILMLAAPLFANAKSEVQQEIISISGVVKDDAGEVIIGAMVFEKENSTNGAVTSDKGVYSLNVPVGTTLVTSFLGYQTLERHVVKGIHHYDFILNEDARKLDEVIVIGYGDLSHWEEGYRLGRFNDPYGRNTKLNN